MFVGGQVPRSPLRMSVESRYSAPTANVCWVSGITLPILLASIRCEFLGYCGKQ